MAPANVLAWFDAYASTAITMDANGTVVIAYSKVVEACGGTKRVFVRAGAPARRRVVAR